MTDTFSLFYNNIFSTFMIHSKVLVSTHNKLKIVRMEYFRGYVTTQLVDGVINYSNLKDLLQIWINRWEGLFLTEPTNSGTSIELSSIRCTSIMKYFPHLLIQFLTILTIDIWSINDRTEFAKSVEDLQIQ